MTKHEEASMSKRHAQKLEKASAKVSEKEDALVGVEQDIADVRCELEIVHGALEQLLTDFAKARKELREARDNKHGVIHEIKHDLKSPKKKV